MPDLERWPPLPLDGWRDTYATLHMWTQIVGKVCLALMPPANHFWNITFQISARGLATPAMPIDHRALTIVFDFVDHQLVMLCSDGGSVRIPLEPRTVAEFYRLVMEALHRLGIDVRIWPMPVEVADPIRFDRDDVHRSYDPKAAQAFWQILVRIKPILERFRCEFIGKCSPVHFFWGSFDVAVTRFSGLRAPEPAGLKGAAVRPAAAFYSPDFNEFILPYEAVRTAPAPADDLTAFLTTTYEAAATLGGWNRADL